MQRPLLEMDLLHGRNGNVLRKRHRWLRIWWTSIMPEGRKSAPASMLYFCQIGFQVETIGHWQISTSCCLLSLFQNMSCILPPACLVETRVTGQKNATNPALTCLNMHWQWHWHFHMRQSFRIPKEHQRGQTYELLWENYFFLFH